MSLFTGGLVDGGHPQGHAHGLPVHHELFDNAPLMVEFMGDPLRLFK